MWRYILRRIAYGILTLWAISLIVFILVRLSGSPLDLLLADYSTPAERLFLEQKLGLDKPVPIQYAVFIRDIVRGDLGRSVHTREPVTQLILSRLPSTFLLAGAAALVSIVIAVPMGVFSAVRRDTWLDYGGKTLAILGQAVPGFWLGIMLIFIFAVKLHWLPVAGKGGIDHLVLPAFTLGWGLTAGLLRITRSSMLDVLGSEYVKMARGKGVPRWQVIWKHGLRNALIAPVTFGGVLLAGLLTGSIIAETVFAWPGIGQLAYLSVVRRDYPMIQAVVLFFGATFVVANLVVDILYAYIDPRIKYS